MNFVLLKSHRVSFHYSTNSTGANGERLYFRSAQLTNLEIPLELGKYVPSLSGNLDKSARRGFRSTSSVRKARNNRLLNIIVQVGFPELTHFDQLTCTGLIRAKDTEYYGLFEALSGNPGEKWTVDVKLENVYCSSHADMYSDFSCNVKDVITYQSNGERGFETSIVVDPRNALLQYWHNSGYTWTGSITLSISVPHEEPIDSLVKDKLCIIKKIINEQVACDVTIIPKNGVHIKCHKSFLFAHSQVMEAMFGSSMKEGQTGTVEILDMEEQSVRAFLAYLYYWDVKQAQENSLVAFELLHAGHKYGISTLENCMTKVLLSKDDKWYDVDVAMRLFLFSRNLPEGDKLKMKAIQVLKSKFSILEKSKCYQELFKKDPKAAMELCKYAFST